MPAAVPKLSLSEASHTSSSCSFAIAAAILRPSSVGRSTSSTAQWSVGCVCLIAVRRSLVGGCSSEGSVDTRGPWLCRSLPSKYMVSQRVGLVMMAGCSVSDGCVCLSSVRVNAVDRVRLSWRVHRCHRVPCLSYMWSWSWSYHQWCMESALSVHGPRG